MTKLSQSSQESEQSKSILSLIQISERRLVQADVLGDEVTRKHQGRPKRVRTVMFQETKVV